MHCLLLLQNAVDRDVDHVASNGLHAVPPMRRDVELHARQQLDDEDCSAADRAWGCEEEELLARKAVEDNLPRRSRYTQRLHEINATHCMNIA